MCPGEESILKTPRFTPERQKCIRFLHRYSSVSQSAMLLASRTRPLPLHVDSYGSKFFPSSNPPDSGVVDGKVDSVVGCNEQPHRKPIWMR